ncbi:MAG: beta-ketoacyl-[acyl-carrier-protein] synthase family protein [Deltaproteobacteria bacterium]|nr:beta-ketoacyl-[acyl-carrier-protein] synthase family protein [Deltaproteobacteria bacterium]
MSPAPLSPSQEAPSRRVVVTGSSAITPLGDSPESLHRGLCDGATGLKNLELFPAEGLSCQLVGEIHEFSARHYLTSGNLRPLDRTAQLATVAALRALEEAGFTAELRQQQDVGLVLGTLFGSVHTISAFDRRALEAGPKYAKPLDFANSVINAAAGQTAIWHDLRGVNSTICSGSPSGLQAIAYAADLIQTGRADTLLAGGADELCFESYLGFHRTGRVAGSGSTAASDETPHPVPFAANRNGFALGEGGALFLLETREQALARGATILGEIRGHGNAFDPSRGKDSVLAAGALRRAIEIALEEAAIEGGQLGAISTSANGSIVGDRHEAQGIAAALGPYLQDLPVTAIKGALGESLGTSSAIQAIALLEALTQRHLPGIAGLDEPDPTLPLPRLSREAQPLHQPLGLVTALDAGGHACAVILESGVLESGV